MGIDHKNTWAVLWSKSQDAFHVETLDCVLTEDWDVFYGTNPNDSDWILMGFADSIEGANALVEDLKEKKRKRVTQN